MDPERQSIADPSDSPRTSIKVGLDIHHSGIARLIMNRRSFFTMVGFTAAGVWLPGCAFLSSSAERENLMDLGTLQHTWTDVDGVRMHSLVSLRSAPSTPAVVLVHGSGLSGRYMVPTAVEGVAPPSAPN